jgi:hypothetical protein
MLRGMGFGGEDECEEEFMRKIEDWRALVTGLYG